MTTYPNFNRGSEWRKWDLHFHTPSSHDYQDKSITDDEIVAGLISNEVAAVAITDHHTIDVNRIKNLQKIAQGKVTIMPGIEFRSELGGSELMHFIGLFPENSDIKYIWKQLQVHCKLDESDIKKRGGLEKTFCDFKETSNLIHKLGGLVSIHAGKKSNSLERLKNDIKDDIELNKCIDILEVGDQKDQEDYLKIVFPNIKRILPIVLCSDNHNINKYSTKHNLWIKSDLTFEGLVQTKYEPLRVYIGEVPPLIKDKNRVIDSITISNSKNWFENTEIPLNQDLCCIIGGKGSGKTALADLIALAGGDIGEKIYKKESFIGKALGELNSTKITLKWLGGQEDSFVVGTNNYNKLEKKVQYLSQGFVEKICSEDLDGNELVKEIEKIVFENLDESEKRNYSDFESLKEAKTKILSKKKQLVDSSIKQLNGEIYTLEEEINSLSTKEKRKESLEKEKDGIEAQKKGISYSTKEEKELQEKIEKLKISQDALVTQIADLKKKVEKIDELKGRIDILETELNEYFDGVSPELKDVGIEEEQIEVFKVNINPLARKYLNQKQKLFNSQIVDLTGDKKSENPGKDTLAFYENEISQLEKQSKMEKGKKDKLGGFQKRIKEIDIELGKLITDIKLISTEKENELKVKIAKRWDIYNSFFTILQEEENLLIDLYKPIQERVASSQFQDEKLLGFEVKKEVDAIRFASKLSGIIHKKRKGKYQEGSEEFILKDVNALCNEIIKAANNKERQLLMEKFIETFQNDNYKIEAQLRDGSTTKDFFDSIFSTEEFHLEYSINFNGIDLDHLTPGSKGIALLILYLGINETEYRPLIIDQPEENLDSRSVYSLLKGYFRKAKNRRQIIMITHNPNLVVNTDAEQVIVANFEREPKNQKAKICYVSGSLENTQKLDKGIPNILLRQGIREHTCEILEGGETAFEERENKYSIKHK